MMLTRKYTRLIVNMMLIDPIPPSNLSKNRGRIDVISFSYYLVVNPI
jgi:hypothetical protein